MDIHIYCHKGNRNSHNILNGNTDGKKTVYSTARRWEDRIEVPIADTDTAVVELIDLDQNKLQLMAVMNTAINLEVS
jgi:hypothetical protein